MTGPFERLPEHIGSGPCIRAELPETGRTPRAFMPIYLVFCGAQSENRTRDLRITNALLYRLSYLGAQVRRA